MEVVYLLTAEIPSEFHCAQITTFHIQQRCGAFEQKPRNEFKICQIFDNYTAFGKLWKARN
jgi:hypothetical protein